MFDAYRDNLLFKVVLWLFAGCVLAFLVVPTLIVIPMSFSASSLLEFPPRAYSLQWYGNFFGSAEWMAALRTSLLLGALTAIIAVPISFLTCFAIDRLGGRIGGSVYSFVMIPAVIPGILMAIGLFFVLAGLGLIGTLTGVLIGHVVLAIPVATVVILPAVRRFEWAQAQAARSLGANWFRVIIGIILPQLSFTLLAATLLAFLTSLDEAVISIFVSSGLNTTLPKLMFISLRDQIDPTVSAISTLWTILVLIFGFVLNAQRKHG